MSHPARRVPVRYFLLLRDLLQGMGVDTQRILDMANIEAALFSNRDGMLTSAEVDRFLLAANKLTGRDDLGFELGRRIKMNSHDILGYGLISCPNFDEYLRLASKHYHLMTETWTLNYRRWYSGGECVYTPTVALPPHSMRFYLETLAVTHHNQLQLVSGQDLPAYDIYLSMPEPSYVQRYLALAPARFHFVESAMPGIRVLMPADLLDAPLALGDVEVMRQIDERCSALRQKPPRGEVGWVDYVMMVLREARGEQATLEDIAKRVKVSARTIDRHLKKEGLGFRELSDKVRFEQACEMLCVSGATVAEVALRLGFSDAANFSRAFRRVMGVTPGEYQRSATAITAA